MTRELKGFKITVTYSNGFKREFQHMFAKCISVQETMDRFASVIAYLETKGEVVVEQIWA